MFAFLRNLFATTDYKALMQRGAIIIDVRTGPEFDNGHLPKSKNIPLDRIAGQAAMLQSSNKPIICCCASGMRSSIAAKQLKARGIEAYNGGSWASLANKLGI